MIVLALAAAVFSGLWLFWKLLGRPWAYALGLIPATAFDLEVDGWKAERDGRFEDAMIAYTEALRLEPDNENVKARRDGLIRLQNQDLTYQHPELEEY